MQSLFAVSSSMGIVSSVATAPMNQANASVLLLMYTASSVRNASFIIFRRNQRRKIELFSMPLIGKLYSHLGGAAFLRGGADRLKPPAGIDIGIAIGIGIEKKIALFSKHMDYDNDHAGNNEKKDVRITKICKNMATHLSCPRAFGGHPAFALNRYTLCRACLSRSLLLLSANFFLAYPDLSPLLDAGLTALPA